MKEASTLYAVINATLSLLTCYFDTTAVPVSSLPKQIWPTNFHCSGFLQQQALSNQDASGQMSPTETMHRGVCPALALRDWGVVCNKITKDELVDGKIGTSKYFEIW